MCQLSCVQRTNGYPSFRSCSAGRASAGCTVWLYSGSLHAAVVSHCAEQAQDAVRFHSNWAPLYSQVVDGYDAVGADPLKRVQI